MRKDEHDNLYLDDGTSLDLNVNYSGLSIMSDGDLAVGFDDCNYHTDKLTPAQRREVAEYMVAEWRRWGGLP